MLVIYLYIYKPMMHSKILCPVVETLVQVSVSTPVDRQCLPDALPLPLHPLTLLMCICTIICASINQSHMEHVQVDMFRGGSCSFFAFLSVSMAKHVTEHDVNVTRPKFCSKVSILAQIYTSYAENPSSSHLVISLQL